MQREFLVVIEKGLDGYLVADVPELPGCHTQAKTKPELLNRVHEVIELYLETQTKKRNRPTIEIEKVVVHA